MYTLPEISGQLHRDASSAPFLKACSKTPATARRLRGPRLPVKCPAARQRGRRRWWYRARQGLVWERLILESTKNISNKHDRTQADHGYEQTPATPRNIRRETALKHLTRVHVLQESPLCRAVLLDIYNQKQHLVPIDALPEQIALAKKPGFPFLCSIRNSEEWKLKVGDLIRVHSLFPMCGTLILPLAFDLQISTCSQGELFPHGYATCGRLPR